MGTIDVASDSEPVPLSLSEVWARVDPLGSDLGADPSITGLGALPYAQLLGPGFERLCYELLVAEGSSPRFFGRRGQTDHGIDIIDETANKRTVYQCKNLIKEPTWGDIREEVLNFESKWIGKAGLAPPSGYVYCCPHSLNDRIVGEEWTRFKDLFKVRTGIEISFWDRSSLDTRLRHLPDIVASLFSDSYAAHFCSRDSWIDDPWVRVRWGNARHASIGRFLDRHGKGAIHVSDKEQDGFRALLSSSPVLAVRGLSGAGKTLTTLELICRLRDPLRRIYYSTLKDGPDVQRQWQSVRVRHSLPAVFVLDDCHIHPEQARILLERLGPELSDAQGNVRLVVILTGAPGPASDRLDDSPDWLVELEQDGLVVDMRTSPERTRDVAMHLRPEWSGLSPQRIERLHSLSGGDLLLLDEILASAGSPLDLDTMRPDGVCAPLRARYFGGNRILPTIRRLASLAQFDLVPLASFIDNSWLPDEKHLAAPLLTEVFAPPRYQFLHSALAQLILRALLELEVGPALVDGAVEATTTADLVAYFEHLVISGPDRAMDRAEFAAAVAAVLRGRLSLVGPSAEAQLKSRVLANETVRMALEENLDRCSFTFLNICLVILSVTDHPAKAQYIDLVTKRFRILFESRGARHDEIGLRTVGTGFYALARNSPTSLQVLEKQHGADGLLSLVVANGTLCEFFRIMQYATPGFRTALLDELNEATARGLIDKTIAAGRSIGTLHLAMRELGDADPALLGRVEQIIGANRFVRLIVANGTLFEFFRIMQYATPGFRTALLDELNEATARGLIDKTIAAGRSIGTLHLAMRELGDADPALLGRVEQIIGANRFVRLIVANGTLFEFFRIMQYATPGFRTTLLDELNEATASGLIDKTIAAGRSIGTFHLAMRELGDADPALLGRVEQIIGANRFVRLIVANGTLFEFFRMMEHATPGFRTALLDELDEATARGLTDKTIAAGRSIGTLDLAMRELGDADPALLGRLEQIIGANRFVRLIVANGTLFEFFRMMERATPGFRTALLDELDEATARGLIDKTLAAGRSIESFHFTLLQLARIPTQRKRLEQLLGTEEWWRLIIGAGTLNSLAQITDAMSEEFRHHFMGASSTLVDSDWQQILTRGLLRNACTFAVEKIGTYPAASQAAFRMALGHTAHSLAAKANWCDLMRSRPPDSADGQTLREGMTPRIMAITLDDLVGLEFSEAVNCFAFAWRERSDLRPALVTRYWSALTEPGSWPKEQGAMAALRLVLAIARSEMIPMRDAQRLHKEVVSFLDREVCANTHTLPLFLLLWCLAALRYERGEDRSFVGVLPNTLSEVLLDVMEERVRAGGDNSERAAQLALAGLLAFLAPSLRKKLRRVLVPLTKSAPWLKDEALGWTFVPALFALEGLALMGQRAGIFTPQVCFGLLWKSEEYEDVGPAIEQLRKWVKR